ncbi:MAG: tRNA pseudouridine(55) synthase TruB [bacterium]
MNIFPVYKPKGPTSFGMISRVRRATGVKKVGHAGTLDPLASGVLIIAVGREATREIHNFVSKEKEYEVSIRLGMNSTTDDAEGEKEIIEVKAPPKIKEVKFFLPDFIGKINQTPPIYSSIKIHGQNAHRLARKGQIVEMKPREVEIKKIEILSYHWPYLRLRVTTGPGVYIRSLARDLGKKLGTGGYVANLIRTRIGDYRLVDCLQAEAVKIK